MWGWRAYPENFRVPERHGQELRGGGLSAWSVSLRYPIFQRKSLLSITTAPAERITVVPLAPPARDEVTGIDKASRAAARVGIR